MEDDGIIPMDINKAINVGEDVLVVQLKYSVMDMMYQQLVNLLDYQFDEMHHQYYQLHYPNNLNHFHHALSHPAEVFFEVLLPYFEHLQLN